MRESDTEIFLIFAVSASIIVILVLLVVLFVIVYQKHWVAREQKIQEREIIYQRELLHATIETQEQERQRLAKELHDSIGSMLTAIKMNLKHQELRKSRHNEDISVARAYELLDATTVEVRRLSHDLLPVTLEKFGLIPAIKDCLAPLTSDHFRAELLLNGWSKRPSMSIELGLLRIVQELLNNSIKHGAATQVSLSFTMNNESVALLYTDNGTGLQADYQSGLGLKNIQSRVEDLHGNLEFFSSQPKGMSTSVHVPLVPPNPLEA